MTAQGAVAARTLLACPCCGARLADPFYEVGPVPVHSCLMLDDVSEARQFPTGTVRIALCEACGFVANTAFDPKWSAYAPNYEDQQSFSPTFNSFANELATGLIERYGLHGKKVVEVGCSKGDFLYLLCEAGGVDAVGIDPSAVAGRVPVPSRGSMRLINAYYGPEHLGLTADMLCCRHTLEHIQPVHETLTLMRQHLETSPDGVLCIEVPDATRLWRDCAFEDIYYEHCSYFTAGSLASAVRRAGFAVTDLRREYGDQYLLIEAVLDPARDRRFEIEETPAETAADIATFSRNIASVMQGWRDRIDTANHEGQKIAIWGSGSKCVAFLRTLSRQDRIDAIVDVNPHRNGKYAPGLSREIWRPDRLAALKPGLVIVMNPVYRAEIARDCAAMGLSPTLVALGDL